MEWISVEKRTTFGSNAMFRNNVKGEFALCEKHCATVEGCVRNECLYFIAASFLVLCVFLYSANSSSNYM